MPEVKLFSPLFPFITDKAFGVLLALLSGLWNLVLPVL